MHDKRPFPIFRTWRLAPLAAVLVACAPNPNDPPTRIDDPKAVLPAKSETKTESKAAEQRRAQAEKRRADRAKATESSNGGINVGQTAPPFTLNDLDGKPVKLADYRGKTVVLEWFNPECPFVKYAHGDSGPLKGQAARVVDEDTVWIAVNSGGVGKQGNGIDKNRKAREEFALDHPILIDEPGVVGRLYGAKTTPHMYVVSKAGQVVYRGGIDNAPMGKVKGAMEAINYVDAALADIAAGRPVAVPETKPYGCSVKYAS